MKTIDETRLSRLMMLIDEYGTAAKLAKAIGVDDSQINQLKNQSPDSKTGKPRTIGNKLARKIEEKLKKGRGWMDQPVYDIDDHELSQAIDMLKNLSSKELSKVQNIVNVVREPEEKYGNGEK